MMPFVVGSSWAIRHWDRDPGPSLPDPRDLGLFRMARRLRCLLQLRFRGEGLPLLVHRGTTGRTPDIPPRLGVPRGRGLVGGIRTEIPRTRRDEPSAVPAMIDRKSRNLSSDGYAHGEESECRVGSSARCRADGGVPRDGTAHPARRWRGRRGCLAEQDARQDDDHHGVGPGRRAGRVSLRAAERRTHQPGRDAGPGRARRVPRSRVPRTGAPNWPVPSSAPCWSTSITPRRSMHSNSTST